MMIEYVKKKNDAGPAPGPSGRETGVDVKLMGVPKPIESFEGKKTRGDTGRSSFATTFPSSGYLEHQV